MSVCPYCSSIYHSTYPPVNLSIRQGLIYDTVAASGQRGTQAKKLITAVYGDSPPESAWGVLRVNIFEINRKLKERGQRIKGRRDAGYVLIRDDDNEAELIDAAQD